MPVHSYEIPAGEIISHDFAVFANDTIVLVDFTYSTRYSPTLMCTNIIKHHEYSHGRERRGKIHDIIFNNINVTAKTMPPSHFSGYDAEHMARNINIINLNLNNQKITSLEEANISIHDYAENIKID